MQTVYVWVGQRTLSVYRKSDFCRQYLEGESAFSYNLNTLQNDMKEFLEVVYDALGMSNDEKLAIELITNINQFQTDAVCECLEAYIIKRINVMDLLKRASIDLLGSEDLMIAEYGINYEKKNYLLKDHELIENEFDLLGYRISLDYLMEVIQKYEV